MNKIYNLKNKEALRKVLRNSPTPQEVILWSKLRRRQLGYKFRRQYSIGCYIVDFCCLEKKLIIEIDGWQHGEENNFGYDICRTKYLQSLGFKIIRFWNNEINKNINGVIYKITDSLKEVTPLSPRDISPY